MDLLKWPIVRSQVRHPSSLLANGNPLHLDRLQPSDRAVLFVCSRSLLQLCSLFLRQLKAASRGKLQWTKYLHTNKQLRYVGNKSKLKHLPIVSKISPPNPQWIWCSMFSICFFRMASLVFCFAAKACFFSFQALPEKRAAQRPASTRFPPNDAGPTTSANFTSRSFFSFTSSGTAAPSIANS